MRTAHRLLAVAGPLLAVLGVLAAAALRLMNPPVFPPIDLDVYLMGARAVAEGSPLYDVSIQRLSFTYPPFAAVLFEPLTNLDLTTARAVLTWGSLACLVVVVLVVSRSLRLRPAGMALLAGAALVSEPLLRTVTLGQVNLYLMALVLVDMLLLPRRWQGWLVGVAAGVKLVPGVFVVYFLLRRQWAAAARAGVAFAATVVVGGLAAPSDSWSFWTGGFLDVSRFGDGSAVKTDNQSLLGAYLRLTQETQAPPVVTALICLASLGVAAAVAARLRRRGDTVGAVVALAVGSLLGSPISWTHHWMWMALALAVLAARGWWLSALALGTVVVVAPMWLLDPRTHGLVFTPGEQVVASVYCLAGLAVLLRLALGSVRTGAAPAVAPPRLGERPSNVESRQPEPAR